MSQKFIPGFADPRQTILCGFGGVQFGLINEGAGAPTNSVQGYQTGAIYARRDGGADTSIYINVGTESSSSWVALVMSALSGLTASAAEINRNNTASTRLVASGASLTVSQALHDGKTIVLAAAAAITLPAFSGSGSRFRFVLPQDASAVTITATGAFLFGGVTVSTDSAFAAGTLFTVGSAVNSGSTTITLNGSSTGGKKGDWILIEDVATNVGIVQGALSGSGTEATPFS